MPRYTTESGKLICVFEGRLDTVTAMKLENEVDIRIRQAKLPVIFDLGLVEFVSSSFVRICVAAVKAAGKDNFCIANAAPAVAKVFGILGMDSVIRADRAQG